MLTEICVNCNKQKPIFKMHLINAFPWGWKCNNCKPPKLLWLIIVMIVILVVWIKLARANEYTDEQIVNAIYHAEGGAKAVFAYGIRSVPYRDISEARRLCFNTVRNNRKRYAEYGYKKYKTYLEFLASKYCPVGCDNDRGTNKFWLRNVRFYLAKK